MILVEQSTQFCREIHVELETKAAHKLSNRVKKTAKDDG